MKLAREDCPTLDAVISAYLNSVVYEVGEVEKFKRLSMSTLRNSGESTA